MTILRAGERGKWEKPTITNGMGYTDGSCKRAPSTSWSPTNPDVWLSQDLNLFSCARATHEQPRAIRTSNHNGDPILPLATDLVSHTCTARDISQSSQTIVPESKSKPRSSPARMMVSCVASAWASSSSALTLVRLKHFLQRGHLHGNSWRFCLLFDFDR